MNFKDRIQQIVNKQKENTRVSYLPLGVKPKFPSSPDRFCDVPFNKEKFSHLKGDTSSEIQEKYILSHNQFNFSTPIKQKKPTPLKTTADKTFDAESSEKYYSFLGRKYISRNQSNSMLKRAISPGKNFLTRFDESQLNESRKADRIFGFKCDNNTRNIVKQYLKLGTIARSNTPLGKQNVSNGMTNLAIKLLQRVDTVNNFSGFTGRSFKR